MVMNETDRIFLELKNVEESVSKARDRLDGLTEYIEGLRKDIVDTIGKVIEEARYTKFNPEYLRDFLAEPYLILPKRMQGGKATEWYVVVPRFIDFQLGWLERSTRSYNVFIVNQYVQWFAEIPSELKDRFHLNPLPVQISDGMLIMSEEMQEEAWKRYRRYLSKREGKNSIRVKRGSEFKLIAQIIEDGSLPFMPRKVEEDDLRAPQTEMVLRDYQDVAWKKFLDTGAVGVYYPFGTGKSMMGVFACAAIKGPKLVVVDGTTLKEKWIEDLKKWTTISHEVQVETYHSFHKVNNNEYSLVVFDECHHLPANTFIRFSTIRAKYRMGLSGSPYREDGRVNYIIALTGYPVGLPWEKFFELGIIRKPSITLFIVDTLRDKLAKLDELVAKGTGKTIIFCDGVELGKKIAAKHGINFVYGETAGRLRLEQIRENEVIVLSRVGDQGISVPDIDTLIEIDFLYGSRMQESQRSGRLLHSSKEITNHYILMTDEEMEKYSKRLLALYERGCKINVIR